MPKSFVLNKSGVKALLKSDEMVQALSLYAQKVKNNADNMSGNQYATDTFRGKNRANASVYAGSKKAYQDNLKNNTLLKALGSSKD